MRHWEHTEVVNDQEFHKISIGGVISISDKVVPPNTAVYVSDGNKRIEGIYDHHVKGIRRLHPDSKSAPNRDLRLYIDAVLNTNLTMIAVDGLMGSGKSSTAVEYVCNTVLANVKANGNIAHKAKEGEPKVLIAKPHVNSGGASEQYGHLPGDINEKLDPTLSNFIQYFDRYHQSGFDNLRMAEYVEVLPLGFIRGLDAKNTTIIADETQNTSELVSLATRKAEGSRIFFLGDTSPFQIDLKGNTPDKNGLRHLIDLLAGAPYFQYIELKSLEHIVRSSEVRDIVRRLFDKYGKDPQNWKV